MAERRTVQVDYELWQAIDANLDALQAFYLRARDAGLVSNADRTRLDALDKRCTDASKWHNKRSTETS